MVAVRGSLAVPNALRLLELMLQHNAQENVEFLSDGQLADLTNQICDVETALFEALIDADDLDDDDEGEDEPQPAAAGAKVTVVPSSTFFREDQPEAATASDAAAGKFPAMPLNDYFVAFGEGTPVMLTVCGRDPQQGQQVVSVELTPVEAKAMAAGLCRGARSVAPAGGKASNEPSPPESAAMVEAATTGRVSQDLLAELHSAKRNLRQAELRIKIETLRQELTEHDRQLRRLWGLELQSPGEGQSPPESPGCSS